MWTEDLQNLLQGLAEFELDAEATEQTGNMQADGQANAKTKKKTGSEKTKIGPQTSPLDIAKPKSQKS